MAAFVDQLTELRQWTDDPSAAATMVADPLPRSARPRSAPRLSPRSGDPRLALLRRVVETEVLPRLVLARRAAGPHAAATRLADETSELVRLVLTDDVARATASIERLRAAGATAETLSLGLLTNAARRLGELWLDDQADFVQVTIGIGHLQRLLRLLASGFQTAPAIRIDAPSVLLMTVPGEQHTFGLSMLGEFFRHAGWYATGGLSGAAADVLDMVHQQWIDVAAFSVGSVVMLEALALLIRRIRRASRNPGLCVMVGGPLSLLMPELARRVGADAAAADAPAAVRLASEMLAMRVAAE